MVLAEEEEWEGEHLNTFRRSTLSAVLALPLPGPMHTITFLLGISPSPQPLKTPILQMSSN